MSAGENAITSRTRQQGAAERMPSGGCYRFRWCGDAIEGITPRDEPLSFYPETV